MGVLDNPSFILIAIWQDDGEPVNRMGFSPFFFKQTQMLGLTHYGYPIAYPIPNIYIYKFVYIYIFRWWFQPL